MILVDFVVFLDLFDSIGGRGDLAPDVPALKDWRGGGYYHPLFIGLGSLSCVLLAELGLSLHVW